MSHFYDFTAVSSLRSAHALVVVLAGGVQSGDVHVDVFDTKEIAVLLYTVAAVECSIHFFQQNPVLFPE